MEKGYVTLTFKIVPEDGGYTSYCVELGTTSCGDTVDEALENIIDAAELHLNTLEELGERHRFFKDRGIKVHREPKTIYLKLPSSLHPSEIITKKDLLIPA